MATVRRSRKNRTGKAGAGKGRRFLVLLPQGKINQRVHPLTSKQFRQPADPDNKTDDTDLAGIFRATANGFGLIEHDWADDYQQLQLLARQRRELVHKTTILR